MKDVKFISPRDIKKGEEFSFGELFQLDDNVKKFEKAALEEVERKAEKEVEVRLKAERKLIEKEKSLLEDEFKSKVKAQEEQLKREIEFASREAKSKLQEEINELSAYKKLSKEYKDQIEELKDSIKDIRKEYSNIAETKIDELREKHKEELEEKIREIEDKKKSATTIGNDAEDEVRDILSSAWPTDRISKPNHATGGADVLHEIENNGKVISSIYYEVKNRKSWSRANYDNFVEKVRNEKHDFNIFISSALPKSSREQHLKFFDEDFMYDEINNIYLLKFENWLPVISALRNQSIKFNEVVGSLDKMDDIKSRVYEFFRSPEFKNYYSRTMNNISNVKGHFDSIKITADKGLLEASKAENEIESLNREIATKYRE